VCVHARSVCVLYIPRYRGQGSGARGLLSQRMTIYNNVPNLTLCRSLFKALLHGQKNFDFFSGHLIYKLKQERFRAFRPAGGF
jgi:homoserine kinase